MSEIQVVLLGTERKEKSDIFMSILLRKKIKDLI